MKVHRQKTAAHSPWTTTERIKMLLWELCWTFLCSWTPKPLNPWRLIWLKIFGAKIYGYPFVHQRARIKIPWNLILHDRACLSDRTNAYSLGLIELHEHATAAQEAYLCTGTHAFNEPAKNLITAPIVIGAHAFIGARAFVMPGVAVGEYAIVGACSVVTRSVAAKTTVAGNPARPLGEHKVLRKLLHYEA
ncbi:DapH/DapD/GlmU-related protein [Cesiribacter sp. SM1]|uniref:DapH/DapD/GlmU-related protein n=1 Tax=Cesiribacter sp. SM1 TaxID=2861196 RepID=UPI001CD5D703|nr:DapH/DapD/GlmU-related protein [Cesiribacter sp. SM1]